MTKNLFVVTLVGSALVMASCAARKAPVTPARQVQVATPTVNKVLEDPQVRQVRLFFERAPAGTTVMLLKEPAKLVQQVDDFRVAMEQTELGVSLLQLLRKAARARNIPLPTTATELASAGIDPRSPVFIWSKGSKQSVMDMGSTNSKELLRISRGTGRFRTGSCRWSRTSGRPTCRRSILSPICSRPS